MSRTDFYLGELPDHPIGSTYPGRREAMEAGLHDNWVPGISGSPEQGANCIALNRGYIDDEDHGDWILYTGAGGNDPATRRQIAHQDLTHRHNAALVYSEGNGLPVRVLRGPRGEKPFAPTSGYRYDGLYKVVRHWPEVGRDGYRIWRFHLVRLTPNEARPWTPEGQEPSKPVAGIGRYQLDIGYLPLELDPEALAEAEPTIPAGRDVPRRATGVVQRIVRSTRVAQFVKEMYGHRCQVCETKLDLPVGDYSEGAHIRPVGKPHNGPDDVSNLLCLCPNDHVRLDRGAIYIDDELTVRDHAGDRLGELRIQPRHNIDVDNLRYHRTQHGHG